MLNFGVFLSKNDVCREAALRIPTVLGMAGLDLTYIIHPAPFMILTPH